MPRTLKGMGFPSSSGVKILMESQYPFRLSLSSLSWERVTGGATLPSYQEIVTPSYARTLTFWIDLVPPPTADAAGQQSREHMINEVYGCESTSDVSVNWPDNWISREEAPTRMLYIPGSATHRCLVVSKKANERWSSSSVTLLESPAAETLS